MSIPAFAGACGLALLGFPSSICATPQPELPYENFAEAITYPFRYISRGSATSAEEQPRVTQTSVLSCVPARSGFTWLSFCTVISTRSGSA